MVMRRYIGKFLRRNISAYPYQRYNDKNKLIFIHIPKTAGSSILNAIGSPLNGRLHIDYFQYYRSDINRFNEYIKFAVVRDPLDKLYSCYRYFINGGNQSDGDLVMKDLLANHCSDFDGFIANLVTPSMMSQWNMLRPQCSYLCSKVGDVMVDVVLKYETLDEDYEMLRERLTWLPQELEKINVSGRFEEAPASIKTIKLVKELYDLDYKYFY